MRKKKLLVRFLSLLLAFALAFNPLVAPLAWAEEEEVPPAEEPAPAEATTECLDCETEDESTIVTGDAVAVADVETDINNNQTQVPGELEDEACGMDLETCGNGGLVSVENDNQVEATESATTKADSGTNTAGGGETGLIDTGLAIASTSIENQVNTNETEFANDGEGEADPSEATDSAVLLLTENENEATVSTETNSEANSGDNQACSFVEEAVIDTGDAVAQANVVNLVNTNLTGSDFEFVFVNIEGVETRDLDLNQLWRALFGQGATEVDLTKLQQVGINVFSLQDLNQALLHNQIQLTADTGTNIANENGQATILTGDALAQANLLNVVNTNIAGTNFVFAVINIFGSLLGDILVPSRDSLVNYSPASSSSNDSVFVANENQASVTTEAEAVANSGKNESLGNQAESAIVTGDALSKASVLDLLGTNIFGDNWSVVLVNNFGNWFGWILGFSQPDSATAPSSGLNQLGLDFNQAATEDSSDEPEEAEPEGVDLFAVANQNQAQIINQVGANANTGLNQANNNYQSRIVTGIARALINIVDLVDTNIFGKNWFWTFINVFGSWEGDLVYTYPDVTTSLSNGSGQARVGEETSYALSYQNQGDDLAQDVWLELDLPAGLTYLGDTSGLETQVSGQHCSWFLGNLPKGQGGSFNIQVIVEDEFTAEAETASFLSWLKEKIVPSVMAAEEERSVEVVATATIGMPYPESNLDNNTASAATLVYFSVGEETAASQEEAGEEAIDLRLPELEITAWNNVGEFVYPGDTVTFEITVENVSEVAAYETYLVQHLFNGIPDQSFGTASFDLGTIWPGEAVLVSFGLKLNGGQRLPVGIYHTLAQASALAPSKVEVFSNEAKTSFELRSKLASLFVPRVKAEEEGEVLAAQESSCPPPEKEILPYLLLFLLSAGLVIEKTKSINQLLKKQ